MLLITMKMVSEKKVTIFKNKDNVKKLFYNLQSNQSTREQLQKRRKFLNPVILKVQTTETNKKFLIIVTIFKISSRW